MGIRARLFVIIFSCLSLGLIFSYIVAERDLGIKVQDHFESELQKQGQIIRENIGILSDYDNPHFLKSETDKYSNASKSRVTFIANDGHVMADSEIEVDDLKSIDNHGNRPEVIDALANGMGWSKRFSETIKQEMMYFAILDSSSEQNNIIRLAMPYNYFDETLNSLENSVTLIFVVALIVSIMAGIIAGNYTRDNLYELEKAVSQLASGNIRKKAIKSLPTKKVDEIGSIARDVSSISVDLKNQMTLLAKQRNQFAGVLDDLGQGIIVFNEDGFVTFSNEESINILNVGDIINKHVSALGSKSLEQVFNQALKKGKYAMEFEHKIDNENRWLLSQMNRTKATKELILVLNDSTELRKMDSMRRDFVANMSHELSTPVSVIRANSETLLDGALNEKTDAKKFTSAILQNSIKLSEMVSKLIHLSRIEYGDQKFNIEKFDLKVEITNALESLRELAKKYNVEFDFDYAGEVMVESDKSALEQILNNLIGNAIKYSTTSIESKSKIEIKIRKNEKITRVSVLDQGVGINTEERKLVFNRFYRTAIARGQSKEGSGLGLAIVKHLVDQLGGEVGVMPRKKGGSRFWFTLKTAN